jgi:predicted phage-related endonuclease
MIRDFTIFDCVQRSPEWFAVRAGLVTGSKAKVVFMKDGTAGREDYKLQLALERLTKKVEPELFVSPEMKHGIEKEPWCRLATEIQYGVAIRQTGFCRHNRLAIGMSFDGDINDFEAFTEFKAPKSKTHVNYMRAKSLPPEYQPQIMHGHLVSGAKHSIFCSGDDRLPEGLNAFFVESNLNDLPMDEYERALAKFLQQVSDVEIELKLMIEGKL